MNRPLVSVITETINPRSGPATRSLPDELAGPLNSLDRQTYPQELIERIVVLDGKVSEADAEEIRRRYPSVKLLSSLASNYFASKNAGAAAAGGEIVAMLDGDCEAEPGWLEALVSRFDPGVSVVAGRTRYLGNSWTSWTFSVTGFSYVLAEEDGAATGFNLNNVAFRRDVLLAHPLEERIGRDGGCYFLYHHLRANGERILYEPRARAAHKLDFSGGLGLLTKHFGRGYDGVTIYRLDDGGVLRGTRLFRRFGAPALLPILGRRVVVDWLRLLRHRRQIGVPVVALPYFLMIAAFTRAVELAGGLAAALESRTPRHET